MQPLLLPAVGESIFSFETLLRCDCNDAKKRRRLSDIGHLYHGSAKGKQTRELYRSGVAASYSCFVSLQTKQAWGQRGLLPALAPTLLVAFAVATYY